MKNKKHSQQDLGYMRPENHTEESKKHILGLIQVEMNTSPKSRSTSPWFAFSGIAASLLFIFFLTKTNAPVVKETPQVEEDVFVTSLLMDTLLLEETELDLAIQEALLDDFENDLALN